MNHEIRIALVLAPMLLATPAAVAGAKPWMCTHAEEICATAGAGSNRCRSQKNLFATQCAEYWGDEDRVSTTPSAPDPGSYRVLDEQRERARAREAEHVREREALLAEQRAAAERYAQQTNEYFRQSEARRLLEQRETAANVAQDTTQASRPQTAPVSRGPGGGSSAKRAHFTHFGRYEQTANSGLKYVVYVANDGDAKLDCNISARGLIWGNEFGGLPNVGLQTEYATNDSATVYPGHTDGVGGISKVVGNTASYRVTCRAAD